MSKNSENTFVFQKNANTQVRCYIAAWKGKEYFHLREWYRDGEDYEYEPGKGLAIPLDKAEPMVAGLVTWLTENILNEGQNQPVAPTGTIKFRKQIAAS